ncbi:hypothetical protein ACHAXT_008914 [Thalassiosira profunda]
MISSSGLPRLQGRWRCSFCLALLFLLQAPPVRGLAPIASPKVELKRALPQDPANDSVPNTYTFSVPLANERPKPESFVETFIELWNDPRPVSSLFADDRSIVDQIEVEGERFQILLYPRGRFVRDSSTDAKNGVIFGAASAYLRYLPKKYGDEVDIAWKLRLCSKVNGNDKTTLSVGTSGGLPRSDTTWSAAMTFCTEVEAVESVGRATDWGSSIWGADDVCGALGNIFAEGEITLFEKRSGESSFFSFPPRGAVGAVLKAANAGADENKQREYRVGEVIVPRAVPGLDADVEALKQQCDKDGNEIFTTESLVSEEEKGMARLALRPCGWKLQQDVWKRNGMKTDWPVEVDAGLLSKVTTTRFNSNSAVPRIVSAFQRDWFTYSLALAVALTPIPLTLAAREFVSLYDIPSASMEPTLLKGDVLLVEKFPKAYERSERGDVVLFEPPPALRDIVASSGSQISGTSLFVKRLAGLPGDRDIRLVGDNEVMINGIAAEGPDRNQCTDEPLRLIDKLLENGKGKEIDLLGEDDTYVLGDCKAVSVDSRVFGTLPKENIAGKPVARIWPLNRIKFGGSF